MAVRLGDLDMCSLLIAFGIANPLSALTRDPDGQVVLEDWTPENEKNMPAVLQLLSENTNMTSSSIQ